MERTNYTRVSEILGWYQDFSKIPAHILERKRDLGTRVHTAIEAHLKGEFYVVADDCKGYIESFSKWMNQSIPEIHLNEHRFYDDNLLITGQVDCIASLRGKLTLIDFKTSHTKCDKFWRLQGGFYHILAKQEYRELKDALFLQLLPNGKIAIEHIYEIDQDIEDLCLSVLRTYQYLL